MRTCNKCNIEQPLDSYFKDKGYKDGVRRSCKACDKAKFKTWREANHEAHNETAKKWNKEHKEICIARATAWNKANPEKRRFWTKMRKEHIKQATPAWADLKAIEAFYANTPAGYHVDHIIPLRGQFVSGLHVLENLQYLPADENLAKGNRVDI